MVRGEEERFAATLDRGLALSRPRSSGRGRPRRVRSRAVAFRLYDTYGFPLDLTEDILAGEGLVVDRDGFEREMERSARGRAARSASPTRAARRTCSPARTSGRASSATG
jgi:alanyl-tRNA synthetase